MGGSADRMRLTLLQRGVTVEDSGAAAVAAAARGESWWGRLPCPMPIVPRRRRAAGAKGKRGRAEGLAQGAQGRGEGGEKEAKEEGGAGGGGLRAGRAGCGTSETACASAGSGCAFWMRRRDGFCGAPVVRSTSDAANVSGLAAAAADAAAAGPCAAADTPAAERLAVEVARFRAERPVPYW